MPGTIVKRDSNGTRGNDFSQDSNNVNSFSASFQGFSSYGSVAYVKSKDLKRGMRVYIQNAQKGLKQCGLLEKDEFISGVLDEVSFVDTMDELSAMESSCLQGGNEMVKVSSMDMYDAIEQFEGMECKNMHCGMDSQVDTKYKMVAKKVKPVALPLPPESKEKMDEASMQPNLRAPNKIGHTFTQETLKEIKIGNKDFLSQIGRAHV